MINGDFRKAIGSLIVVGLTLGNSAADLGQEMKLLSSPAIGVESTVSAGGEVYSYIRVYTIDGARLEAGSGPRSYLRGRSVAAGTELVPVPTKSAYKGCVPEPGTFRPVGPCFMDDDGDGRFDRQSTDDYNIAAKLKKPIPYLRVPVSVARADAFKRVVLFQGATSDSLRFSYREFSNDMARPAFTEDLSIPRERFPSMIMVKNLQLEVLGVSGMGMRYRVVNAN